MPKERNVPYVASGFREDAERLLNKFVAGKSLKFHAFAAKWRELKFSLIFMGKENMKELVEFTEECYRNALLLMNDSDPVQKVGAVYLLYSLYLKQPLSLLKVPVRIRMCQEHIHELLELESYFQDEEDLKYIIYHLFNIGAIYISHCPIPMGPAVPIPLLKLAPSRSSCFKDALRALRSFNEKEIKNISSLTEEYYERLKKAVPPLLDQTAISTEPIFRFKQLKQSLGELEDNYNAGLPLNKVVTNDVAPKDEFRALGQSRTHLKAQQYGKAVEVGQSRKTTIRSDDTPSRNSTPTPVPVKRSCGRPKIKRQRGRKKKVVEVKVKQKVKVGSVVASLSDKPGPSGERGRKKKVVEVKVKQKVKVGSVVASLSDKPGPSGVPRNQGRKPKSCSVPVRRHYFEEEDDDDDDEEEEE